MHLPDSLQNAIERELAGIREGALAAAAQQMSASYRRGEGASLGSAHERAAYLVTRMPATFAACHSVLEELRRRNPSFEPRSLLDLGSGPGTALWAAANVFPGIRVATLVEGSSAMLGLGRRLSASSPHAAFANADWVAANLADPLPDGSFELITINYALGELALPAARNLVERAWQRCSGALLVVEPGSVRGFQRVLMARGMLLGCGAHMVAPCPHANACPLSPSSTESGVDWCHFAARLERTAQHRRLKSAVLGYEDEKFSYVAVARAQCALPNARVVSRPTKGSGHVKFTLCTPAGLRQTTVTRSQREQYRQARGAEWGSALEILRQGIEPL